MADSYIGFFGKCWEFITYVINFFRGKKQEEANKINTTLQDEYNRIDQDKENNKQHDTQDRLDNLFK